MFNPNEGKVFIDGNTSIPQGLFERMENDANQDRGVHVPKKNKYGEIVLIHTGVY